LQGIKKIVDKLGSRIPGFEGYKDRDNRRSSDKLLRMKISEKLQNYEHKLDDVMKEEIKNNHFDLLSEIEDCRQRLNILSDKIKYAPYGESSFFSNAQIKENELDNIHNIDLELFSRVEISESEFKNLSINEIRELIDEIENFINKRNDLIKERK